MIAMFVIGIAGGLLLLFLLRTFWAFFVLALWWVVLAVAFVLRTLVMLVALPFRIANERARERARGTATDA